MPSLRRRLEIARFSLAGQAFVLLSLIFHFLPLSPCIPIPALSIYRRAGFMRFEARAELYDLEYLAQIIIRITWSFVSQMQSNISYRGTGIDCL